MTIHWSLWDQTMARTGESCACRMVSKLKVSPFQRVNSPLDAPVISLRPSGVQARVKTGHRILLVAVFTNLVVTALAGLSRRATGGRSLRNEYIGHKMSSLVVLNEKIAGLCFGLGNMYAQFESYLK